MVILLTNSPEQPQLHAPVSKRPKSLRVKLDEEGITALYTLIGDFQTQFGTSFLLSSHQELPANYLPGIRNLIVDNNCIKLT